MDNSLKLIHLARDYLNQNNLDQAKKLLLLVIDKEPFNQQANELIASIYELDGDLSVTREHLIKACSITNPDPKSLYKLGAICLQLSLYFEAKNSLLQSLETGGEFFEGLHDLGLAYAGLGELEKSKFYLEKAVQLKNNSPTPFFNLGKIHHDLGEFKEAIIFYENCLNLDTNFLPALYSKADVLKEMNKLNEAINCYDKIFKLRPNEADALCGVSTLHLLKGDFQKGWSAYSHRWKQMQAGSYRYSNIKELETIAEAKGKNLLVWYEQGMGDSIQFSRYIPLLLEAEVNLTFEVQKPLETLFKRNYFCNVISTGSTGEEFDFQTPLLNLPRLFNTDLTNIPLSSGYIKVDLSLVSYWKNYLHGLPNKINIAIAISGNRDHINDRNRSINLNYFEELSKIANLFIVQKEIAISDFDYLKRNKKIFFLGDDIQSFNDTAAILESMDLVVSVDTSLIHLAGAMGKNAILLLPFVPEWRWLLDRSDSPWYKSIQILRQRERGDWKSVIDKVLEFVKKQ